jgi:phage shock protein A
MSATLGPLMATVKDLDTRLDEYEQVFAELTANLTEFKAEVREFRAEVRTLVTLGKWLAGFAAVAIFGMIAQTFAIARTAGALENQVNVHGLEIGRLREKTDQLSTSSARVEQKLDALADVLRQVPADLRKDRPAK